MIADVEDDVDIAQHAVAIAKATLVQEASRLSPKTATPPYSSKLSKTPIRRRS